MNTARQRNNAALDGQLALPLFEPLVEHGLQQLHHRPWVGDEEKLRRGRRPAPEAWDAWPYVETHPAHTYAGLFFDIDEPDRWVYEVDGPCPNWQIRKDGLRPTYHVAYTLQIPVARHDAAQYRIIQYYRDIYDGLSCLFGADPHFDGVMAKNPLHPPAGCTVDWIRHAPYTLVELREWLPAEIPKPVYTTGCPASTIFAGWRQSVLPVHLLGLAPLLGSVGAVAGDVKLQDDGVMDHPVDCRGGGHGVGEDAFPLREDQV